MAGEAPPPIPLPPAPPDPGDGGSSDSDSSDNASPDGIDDLPEEDEEEATGWGGAQLGPGAPDSLSAYFHNVGWEEVMCYHGFTYETVPRVCVKQWREFFDRTAGAAADGGEQSVGSLKFVLMFGRLVMRKSSKDENGSKVVRERLEALVTRKHPPTAGASEPAGEAAHVAEGTAGT